MEEKANGYLELLSATDFHGEIRLRQTADDSTEIRLYSSNGTEIKKPSGSQLTVMYISVLLLFPILHKRNETKIILSFSMRQLLLSEIQRREFL